MTSEAVIMVKKTPDGNQKTRQASRANETQGKLINNEETGTTSRLAMPDKCDARIIHKGDADCTKHPEHCRCK